MDIFGMRWENHAEKFTENWKRIVNETDTVVIPGDISWGIDLDSAYLDLKLIDSLPGKKIIGKGNHDYWWTTVTKMKKYVNDTHLSTIEFLYNNAFLCEDKIICGTRGWINEFGVKTEDERIIKREAERLKLSLLEGEKLKSMNPTFEIMVFMHYPPVFGGFLNLDIIDILYSHNIHNVYYGHLHGMKKEQLDNEYIGISLTLTSCDYVNFIPVLVN
jgi:Predicted phosphohydrolase